FTPKSAWESDVAQNDDRGSAKRLTSNDDTKEVLQAVVKDVLTNPALGELRKFFVEKASPVILVDSDKLAWPINFKPDTYGFKLVKYDQFEPYRASLGIELAQFDLPPNPANQDEHPIKVRVCSTRNAFGFFRPGQMPSASELDAISGHSMYYGLKRVGNKWVVEFNSIDVP